jgi:hypothetical protein
VDEWLTRYGVAADTAKGALGVGVRALSAIARSDSEPESAVADLRACGEALVDDLLAAHALPEEISARKRTAFRPPGRSRLQSQLRLQAVRVIGNRGAHPRNCVDRRQLETALSNFCCLVEWVAGSQPSQRQP